MEKEKEEKSKGGFVSIGSLKITGVMASLMALFVSTASGYIMFMLNTWVKTDLIPNQNIQQTAAENFVKRRSAYYDNFMENYAEMRAHYYYYLLSCQDDKGAIKDYKSTHNKNKDLLNKTINSGQQVNYYFGNAIREIVHSELAWYFNNIKTCPDTKVDSLLFRQEKLRQVMLSKMYNPLSADKHFNNPDFQSYD